MSPGSGSVTPSSKNIRELTERWEERSISVDSIPSPTPTNSSVATTPVPTQSFSRRSTQETLLMSSPNSTIHQGMAATNAQVQYLLYRFSIL